MEIDVVNNPDIINDEHTFVGRTIIYTSREDINESTIPSIINGAMTRHLRNRAEIEYLYRYFKGDQPILRRIKQIRPDINNRIVINNANSIVRNATGYFIGEPIQYTAKNPITDSKKVLSLNNFMDSENKSNEDMAIGSWDSICGTAYRLISVDEADEEDEAPFEIPTLDPRNSFVIYSTRAGNKPVLGCTYNDVLNDDGFVKGTEFTVYDDKFQYIYQVEGGTNTQIKPKNLIDTPKPHFLGDVPIVEYPNNEWRLGDFETVITILNAINKLQSDRVNSVEQVVNSILVFIGCHLKSAAENKAAGAGDKSDFDILRENLAIELPESGNGKADVKYVNSSVNQNEAETLAQTLIDYVYMITGIPDRKKSANSSGDTGDAVYLRDGFQSLELVTRIKERNFKKAEKTSLRMICKILDKFSDIQLKPMQVDIKFVRNRTNNLLNKSQAVLNLKKSQIMAPADIITLAGFTDTPEEMAKRGEDYYNSLPQNATKTEDGTEETASGSTNSQEADNFNEPNKANVVIG